MRDKAKNQLLEMLASRPRPTSLKVTSPPHFPAPEPTSATPLSRACAARAGPILRTFFLPAKSISATPALPVSPRSKQRAGALPSPLPGRAFWTGLFFGKPNSPPRIFPAPALPGKPRLSKLISRSGRLLQISLSPALPTSNKPVLTTEPSSTAASSQKKRSLLVSTATTISCSMPFFASASTCAT